ncbi:MULTISPECIES: DUF4257 domain-containing protein [unclassified Paenibacillus]|uniref:DUF4257 domain-containing protein n=1 Tax=Paenibacillus provencensis TaxID=441151 RepID=A0ABW3Q2H8_9BACL|nr:MULTISPECIES: DUF4257 domain-containing protein [unclassified Paenibacillus]MCM3130606.1 DUF4257 domain-containing protein [Paenibacillus sp. MER 78]SDX74661.1 Protein of unknown function [Paenibacillus sp. PDC88]SFS89930.1 Protein of unknown function [Paenibacillus sp. 453mf]
MELLIAFVVGGLTNLFVASKLEGGVLLPYIKKVGKKRFFIPGLFGDFVIGGAAALAAFSFFEPVGYAKIIGTSVLAGFNGLTYLAKNALSKVSDVEAKTIDEEYQKLIGIKDGKDKL